MRKTIKIVFDYGDLVILKTDPCTVRQITSILLKPDQVIYGVSKGTDEETWHDASQITLFKDNFVVRGFHQKSIYAKKS